MTILVINSGSSSIKYSLFDFASQKRLISGVLDRIGEPESTHHYQLAGQSAQQVQLALANHAQALQNLFRHLQQHQLVDETNLQAIGHRVVHGGEQFQQPIVISEQVIAALNPISALAPLHNPANLLGIQAARQQFPTVLQIAVFDTAFHHSLPDYAFRYAIPESFYHQHAIRRYGFHGSSHSYVAKQAAAYLAKSLEQTKLISLHLGNGASITAIENGRSIDTSMGMTPLEGLMMGTRSGDIDAGIIFYLGRELQLTSAEIEKLLNKASGCKGICGENDMRTIHQLANNGNSNAQLALAMYAYRIKKYIGAYLAVLGKVDALVFTGGIGEHDSWLRAKACENLQGLGIIIDPVKNAVTTHTCAEINAVDSPVKLLVIATDEELEIAMQTASFVTPA